jgi:exopolysaccharide biosynthesis WecB/TagA/CpsF family protein
MEIEMLEEIKSVIVGGIKTVCLSRSGLCAVMVQDCMSSRNQPTSPKVVFDLNGHALALAQWDKRYRADLLAADLVHADGQPCVLASRYLTSTPIPERSVTTDYFHDAATVAVKHGLSFYLLGSTEDNNAQCAAEMLSRYPGLHIAGRHHGYFSEDDEAGICDAINASKADIVWVGLGKPKEQAFCIRNRHRIRAGWMVSCGGCFNYVTGVYDRAPAWMQRNGLEWLFRFIKDPRVFGIRYITTNPVAAFVLLTRTRDA